MQIYRPDVERSRGVWGYIIVAVLAFVIGWQFLAVAEYFGYDDDEVEVNEVVKQADLDLFWGVWERLHQRYLRDEALDEDELIYGAIAGMVKALDDSYTVFMNPEESEAFTASLNGKLEGIGAELTVEQGILTIVSPLRDSPAERAGLEPGDIIYQIEDEFTGDMTLMQAVTRIRGEKGTAVKLTLIRDDVPEPFDVSIIRDSIDLDAVTVEELNGDITYLSVNQFNDKTLEQFSNAVSDMLDDKPQGVIVDLRFNGGGYLDIAVDLLSFLLPSQVEAVTLQERGMEDDVRMTNGGAKITDVPLVVLVNQGSASASEILAGAVQDHERGVIMGTQSFGKGTVQEVEYFNDGSSLRMTIARWITPSDQDINKVGITPDVIVEISDEDIENDYDRQKEDAAEYLRGL
ncbi:S41 family peptidase [Candidatus Gracilibacteria bacterium]|nr:S41 family peptidase [Candidatus Gracilibacteria bacterium]